MSENKAKIFLLKFKNKGFKVNSFISNSLRSERLEKTRQETIDKIAINLTTLTGLSPIGNLYLYASPPPYGYGSPAPKVAESVIRAYSYNKKEGGKSFKIDTFDIEDPSWNETEIFNCDDIHSNYSPYYLKEMSKKYLKENFSQITDTCIKLVNKLLISNADVLTKGRQTWDPFIKKSIPSSSAFQNMVKFLENNTEIKIYSCIDLLQAVIECMKKDEIKIKERKILFTVKRVYNKKKKEYVYKHKKNIKIISNTIRGDEVIKYILETSRTFCSYIKHAERGKQKRRAIASANIILRNLLYIVEEFHLELGKVIKGSTISIGGEEKKQKIQEELSKVAITGMGNLYILTATEDATKWNETLSPGAFYLMHNTFFDDDIRKELDLPLCSKEEKFFEKMCNLTFLILSIKKIHLGHGLKIENDDEYKFVDWDEAKIDQFNKFTQEWFSKIKDTLKDGYIEASPGFLMGMLNAASTTLGLICVGYGINERTQRITTLRSSDDSMTNFTATQANDLLFLTVLDRVNRKLIGINISIKKSFIFRHGFGEYTSWYMDGDFVNQTGTEVPSLRPSAQNPQDDFNVVAKNTQVSLNNLVINVFGAVAKVCIGIENIRRLYRIQVQPNKREGVSNDVLFLSDGGKIPWGIYNLVIDEATIRYNNLKTEQDKKYFYIIMNPDNIFSSHREETIMYSRETNKMYIQEPDTPRNVFCYIKRSNRSLGGKASKNKADLEKLCSEIFDVMTSSDLTLNIKIPNSKHNLRDHLLCIINLLKIDSNLSIEEHNIYEKAVNKLKGDENNDDEDLDFFDVEDVF